MKTKSELTIILSEKFGNEILTRKEISEYLESENLLGSVASAGAMTRFLGTQLNKVGHGKYQLPNGKNKKVKTKTVKEKLKEIKDKYIIKNSDVDSSDEY